MPYQKATARQTCRQLSAEKLSDLLQVSLRTAQRYRAGASTPSRSALLLIELELAGRILPRPWHKLGLHFERGELKTPHGFLRAGMVEQYGWFLQNYRVLLSDSQRLAEKLDFIYSRLSLAERLELAALKRRLPGLRPLKTG